MDLKDVNLVIPILDDSKDIPSVNDFDVPQRIEIRSDGTEVIVIGEPQKWAEIGHIQGDNGLGFKGTCGLVSCETVIKQFDIEVSESEIVDLAARHGWCVTDGSSSQCGGTQFSDMVSILDHYDIVAHEETVDSLEDIASFIDEGRTMIVGVNAGILWDDVNSYDFGQANHAIVVTGYERDIKTGVITGVYINDSGSGDFGKLIDVQTMQDSFVNVGGRCVVTDRSIY